MRSNLKKEKNIKKKMSEREIKLKTHLVLQETEFLIFFSHIFFLACQRHVTKREERKKNII